ncbi:DUF397 domain-containing protein [Micromonospora matsumotoense]
MADPAGARRWRRSIHSGGNSGECVEVADNQPVLVAVRDRDDPTGPILTFSPSAWGTFMGPIRR